MIEIVKEIPKPIRTEDNTDKGNIRKDIKEAIENKIVLFEFVGDYNYEYLPCWVREEAENIFASMFLPIRKRVAERVEKELDIINVITKSHTKYKNSMYKVTTVKQEDRRHVYMKIDYDFINTLEETLYETTLAYYKKDKELKNILPKVHTRYVSYT